MGTAQQAMVLRQTLPQAVAAPGWDEEEQRLLKRLQELEKAPPTFTPEQVQQRRDTNQREYEAGLLGMLSGQESLAGAGGLILKNALSNRAPKISEKGTMDPISGEWTYDPDYLRQQTENRLSVFRQARAAAEERRQAAQERNAYLLAMKGMSGGSGKEGKFMHTGYDSATGQRVVTGKDDGLEYTVTPGPNGPVYSPYSGTAIPKGTWDKQVVEAQEAQAGATRADALVSQVEKNPDAFGWKAAAVATLPGQAQTWANKVVNLTPKQLELRAQVTRDAAMELNRIYGAAQSAGELARAAAWAPNAQDELEGIIVKLKAARNWERARVNQYGTGVGGAAAARNAPGAVKPGGGKADPLGVYDATPGKPTKQAPPQGSW